MRQSGLVTSMGASRHSVFYYWIFSNCNVKDGIGSVSSSCVDCRKSIKYRGHSNREVILRSGSKRCNGSKGGIRLGCTGLGPLYISIHHGCDLCFSS